MGFMEERYGMVVVDMVKPGACLECGAIHSPEQPHNRDSLLYQYKFYDKHGRWPTWSDAMGHCSKEVKELRKQALMSAGLMSLEMMRVYRKTGSVDVLILPHKDGGGYSFVNLTKGHICPCKFATIQDAIADLNSKKDVMGYEFLTGTGDDDLRQDGR